MDAILQAALQVLVAVGPERATTTAIARRAGVSVGSLYQYYPNKHALVAALADRHVAAAADAVDRAFDALEALPLEEGLARMVEAVFGQLGRPDAALLAR